MRESKRASEQTEFHPLQRRRQRQHHQQQSMHGMTYESPPPLGPNCAPVSAVQPAGTDAAVLAGWKEIILVHVGSVVVGHHPYLRFGLVWVGLFVCV
jgi:hypothetical protein